MDLLGSGSSTMAIFLFLVFPLGSLAVSISFPSWDESKWGSELESFRLKYSPDVKGGADGPIPELIECGFRQPKKFPQCSDNILYALVSEIKLRKQFKGFNEECNSAGTEENEPLLKPPKWQNKFGNGPYGFDYEKYIDWQEKLLNSQLHFCDPHTFLRCSAEKKCVCIPGSVRVGKVCVYSHNFACAGGFFFLGIDTPSPQDGVWYFDPFKINSHPVQERAVQVIQPECLDKDDECQGQRESTYHRELSYCFNVTDESQPLHDRVNDVRSYFDGLSPLFLNAKCSFQDHNRLLTSTKEEDDNFEIRLKTLEEIKIRGARFCDLRKFLTCGPSGKCECMSPSSEKDGKCVLPGQMDKCQMDPTMEPILMNKTLVTRARADLMQGFVGAMTGKACKEPLKCHADMMEIYCTCPPGTTGVNCEDGLTRFLPIVRVPSLPIGGGGYAEKIKIFSEFNRKVLKFEDIFGSGDGDTCVWKFQNEAEILVGRIQKLNYPGVTMTKSEYEELSKDIENSTIAHFPFPYTICSFTLRCQHSANKCVHQTRRDYLQDLVKELQKSKTLKCEERGCSQFPRLDDVMFGGKETEFYGGEDGMEYYDAIQRYSDLLNSNAKFCADGGSCFGRTCCEVPVVDLKKEMKMNNTKMVQSFADSCHSPNNFILHFSVAMIFVVSNC